MSPLVKMSLGLGATLLSAWAFHDPGGYGQRAIAKMDAQVQPIVARQELPGVTVAFARDPLSRDLRLQGQANAFQRGRFVETLSEAEIRGLRSVAWADGSGRNGSRVLPLLAESMIWQVGAFLLGLSCAYGIFGRARRGYR